MTKKEFIQQVVEQLKENPRKVLAGHGIQAAVLQKIISRPDVMARLVGVLWTLRYAKKGAMGLKKQKNFWIKGYKTFPELNAKAREDVEAFIAGLDEKDAAEFKNDENIVTILMTPDTKPVNTQNVTDEIVTGPSILVKFDSAVRREYKIPGGTYLVVMIAKSAVRPAEEKAAARLANKNKRRVTIKKTPAKLRKELKEAANRKLAILKKQREALQNTAASIRASQQQFIGNAQATQRAALAAQLGGMSVAGANSAAAGDAAFRASLLNGLTPEDKGLLKTAQKLWNKGKKGAAKSVVRGMENAKVGMQLLTSAPAVSGDQAVRARKAALKAKIAQLNARNEQLLLDLELAPANKRRSIQSMISKVNAQIKQLRAQLGTYTNMSVAAKAKKSDMLVKVNAMIDKNIARGKTITQALNNALAAIDAKPAQKQVIKQQVMQQVAEGMPVQYAVQQAIQDNYVEEVAQQAAQNVGVTGGAELSGDFNISDLLAAL